MGVRQPNGDRFPTRGCDLLQDQVGFLARIHDGALSRLLVHDEVAVLDELAVRNLDDLHQSPLRSALRYFSTAIAAVVPSPTAVVIWRVN